MTWQRDAPAELSNRPPRDGAGGLTDREPHRDTELRDLSRKEKKKLQKTNKTQSHGGKGTHRHLGRLLFGQEPQLEGNGASGLHPERRQSGDSVRVAGYCTSPAGENPLWGFMRRGVSLGSSSDKGTRVLFANRMGSSLCPRINPAHSAESTWAPVNRPRGLIGLLGSN